MTILTVYECDRCHKLVFHPRDSLYVIKYQTEGDGDDWEEYHLCSDCDASWNAWVKYVKKFDDFAEKVLKEGSGDDE